MRIASIDIGYYNLGLVVATVTEDFVVSEVDFAQKIDLGSSLIHGKVSRRDCGLYHTNHMCDKVDHFIQEYGDLIKDCDVLLLERQPPGGFGNIESLLCKQFRCQAVMIHPRSLHKFLNTGNLSYEERKVGSELAAADYLEVVGSYLELERKHDVADAMCMILYYLHLRREVKEREEGIAKVIGKPFDMFLCRP